MKYITILILAISAIACTKPRVPQGYQTCQSDLDCPHGYVCGYAGIDTYPVCIVSHKWQ
jgi:hypothetical protein